jgi:hypothetical protein
MLKATVTAFGGGDNEEETRTKLRQKFYGS